MAKKDQPLNLADLNSALASGKMTMNTNVAAQLSAALASGPAENDNPASPKVGASIDNSAITKLNSNIINLAKVIEKNTKILQKKSDINQNDMSGNDITENEIEQGNVQTRMIKLLETIEVNTRHGNVKEKQEKEEKGKGFGIGGILLAGAVLIAGITAWIKNAFTLFKFGIDLIKKGTFALFNLTEKVFPSFASKIKYFVEGFKINLEFGLNIVKDFFRNKIATPFTNISRAISDSFGKIKTNLVGTITESFGKLKSLFNFGKEGSVISSAINMIKSGFSYFVNIVKDAGTAFKQLREFAGIGKFFAPITKFFESAFTVMSKFGGAIKFLTPILGKILLPIQILMSAFDFVSGAIDGFKKDGIIGAITGGIGGLLGGLVGGLADLVKSILSTILGFFGLDAVEKWLDSFSFTDIIKNFFGALGHFIRHPIDSIMDAIKGLGGMVADMAKSAIDLVTSVVWAPVDLLKDAVSYVLDAFGFDKASKFLDSFSFTGILKDFAEAIFHPFDTISKLFSDLGDWFTNFEIPGIGFSVLGKEFKFGPWHPFKKGDEKKSDDAKPAAADSKGAKGDQAKGNDKAKYAESIAPAITQKTEGWQSGVTDEQIKSHPNYKKYYDREIKAGEEPEEAEDTAATLVQMDIEENPKGSKAPASKAPAGAKPAAAGKAPMTSSVTKTTEGTLSGVTSDEIHNHPNYDKYKLAAEKINPRTADRVASAKVRDDMVAAKKIKEMDAGIAPAAPNTANKVSQASSDLEMAKQKQPASSNTVVSAPTNITKQTKNVMVKQPTRNPEGSITSYFKSKFA